MTLSYYRIIWWLSVWLFVIGAIDVDRRLEFPQCHDVSWPVWRPAAIPRPAATSLSFAIIIPQASAVCLETQSPPWRPLLMHRRGTPCHDPQWQSQHLLLPADPRGTKRKGPLSAVCRYGQEGSREDCGRRGPNRWRSRQRRPRKEGFILTTL